MIKKRFARLGFHQSDDNINKDEGREVLLCVLFFSLAKQIQTGMPQRTWARPTTAAERFKKKKRKEKAAGSKVMKMLNTFGFYNEG